MTYVSFRQIAYLLGATPSVNEATSASSMATAEGVHWPPPPEISLRALFSFVTSRPMQITGPVDDPFTEWTTAKPGVSFDAPPDLLESPAPLDCTTPNSEGRLVDGLRSIARLRNGNTILEAVAELYVGNYLHQASHSQEYLTAATQLAVTGSSAFAAWSKAPTTDLTSNLTTGILGTGMPPALAATTNQQIFADFNAALQAVRNPGAGMNEASLRAGLNQHWIAVSGEDDPPDFPVNVSIAPYPQYHLNITVQNISLNIRYIIASQHGSTNAPRGPSIPPGDEVIIYIHGEGSKAEEACDFIDALFKSPGVGRSFTVIAFDQPSCGYSTMVPHQSVAPMSPNPGGVIDTSPFSGSPILDFVFNTTVTFVETLMASFPNKITAVIGGSLGGHMALRLAASNKDWVRNVIAWSPASVWEYAVSLCGIGPLSFAHRVFSDPKTWPLAMDGPTPPWPASMESAGTRQEFFASVWCKDTFNALRDVDPLVPPALFAAFNVAIIAAISSAGILDLGTTAAIIFFLTGCIMGLPTVPPQPQMWYSPGWGSKSKYIDDARRERRETYNTNLRQWHWRIAMELIGFKFDSLAPSINKPLLLMVGDKDDFPQVYFLSYVQKFATALKGLGKCMTIKDTGHSIHNERPYFLADQILRFAPRP